MSNTTWDTSSLSLLIEYVYTSHFSRIMLMIQLRKCLHEIHKHTHQEGVFMHKQQICLKSEELVLILNHSFLEHLLFL